MAVERWSPFREMTPLREMVDRLLEEAFIPPRRMLEVVTGWSGMDLYERDGQYVLELPLPGTRPEDVNISVTGNTLTISGTIPCPSTLEKGPRYLFHHRPCGEFRRTVTLPGEVDASRADATFENGLLRLTLPQTEATRPRRIEVKTMR